MPAVNVKYTSGVDKFLSQFKKNKHNSLTKIGLIGVANIKSETPVDTGLLKDSNDYRVVNDDVEFFNNTNYASYVEYGTYKQSANPYTRRGINKSIPAFKSILQSGLSTSSSNYNINLK